MTKKLFAGHILRKIRENADLSQVDFARRLNLSPSYVNQLESNLRPISASVLIAVSREFGADLSSFETNDLDRLVSDLSEAFADTRFHSGSIGLQELKSVAIHTPDFARAVLDLYGALRHMSEQQAFIDDAIVMHGQQTEPAKRLTSPYEEVRDYFHYTDNYVDDLDTAAESLANELGLAWHADRFSVLANWLTARSSAGRQCQTKSLVNLMSWTLVRICQTSDSASSLSSCAFVPLRLAASTVTCARFPGQKQTTQE